MWWIITGKGLFGINRVIKEGLWGGTIWTETCKMRKCGRVNHPLQRRGVPAAEHRLRGKKESGGMAGTRGRKVWQQNNERERVVPGEVGELGRCQIISIFRLEYRVQILFWIPVGSHSKLLNFKDFKLGCCVVRIQEGKSGSLGPVGRAIWHYLKPKVFVPMKQQPFPSMCPKETFSHLHGETNWELLLCPLW